MNLPITYSAEVTKARENNTPVVALESTIITHGMPFPQNLETARMIEQDIRSAGAIPATIAVMGGKIHIGLESIELQELAQAKDVMKLSRADLAFAIAMNKTGATTVAATMICAALADIKVFATGGIGGVHKGAEKSFDISADLQELALSPVIVVAAGAKAILDIAKTLEVLETSGVTVSTFAQDDFPAFWSRSSGLKSPLRFDTAQEIADTFKTKMLLNQKGGMLIANPIPHENEIPAEFLAPIIEQAVNEAEEKSIEAKQVTPFLLQRIFELTEGRSLDANIALVRNNAALAVKIAKSL